MKLTKILDGIETLNISGNIDIDISKIQYDSRKVEKGDVFFCISGYNLDGHDYAKNALAKGASVIICEKEFDFHMDAVVIKVKDTRKALALCSSNYYDNPTEKINIIGITGTNGKTTSTYMIKSILERAGFKVGVVGTIANYVGNKKIESHRTTPESLELQELFKMMVDEKVDYCVMEVSSHSLALGRVFGINFKHSIFTNLTQDHLDFHKNFEDYFSAKFKLFENSSSSIVNIDDEYGMRIYKALDDKAIAYGINKKADFNAENIVLNSKGVEFELLYKNLSHKIRLSIPGKYNIYNALGCIGVCIKEGIDIEKIIEGLRNVRVPGRCEIVTSKYDLGFDVVIDYAHSPDGLKNILSTAREFTKGRLISVFGCGGDRDKKKRPIMGNIGSVQSDFCIVTSDNPRTEEPMKIIDDVVEGIKKDNYIIVENRREAIKKSMSIAKENDVIVIAGKGHEDYQILKDKTIHFDEREIVEELIGELF
jgi:UDP-N-acetylmuramoyl-L-alanyl-D-glutamate--2,6-diaminopimelate ligase